MRNICGLFEDYLRPARHYIGYRSTGLPNGRPFFVLFSPFYEGFFGPI